MTHIWYEWSAATLILAEKASTFSLRPNSSQCCSIGCRPEPCADRSGSSTVIHVLMDLALCTCAQSCCASNCFYQGLEHSSFHWNWPSAFLRVQTLNWDQANGMENISVSTRSSEVKTNTWLKQPSLSYQWTTLSRTPHPHPPPSCMGFNSHHCSKL